MIIKKTTIGFVTQTFDTETGKYTGQEFVCGDQVDYEDEDGELLDGQEVMPDPEPYLPFHMVQPED